MENEILAHLQKQVPGLQQQDIRVIRVPRSSVLCNQIQMAVAQIDDGKPCHFIVLIVEQQPRQQPQQYYMTHKEWLTKCKLMPPENRYRLIRLGQLLKLVVSQQPEVALVNNTNGRSTITTTLSQSGANSLRCSGTMNRSNNTNMDDDDGANDNDNNISGANTMILKHIGPLWLDDQWTEEIEERMTRRDDSTDGVTLTLSHTTDYITLFFDFIMMRLEWQSPQQQRYRGNNSRIDTEDRVERDWLHYLDLRAQVFGHNHLAFFFLGTYCSIARRPLEQDLLLQQWLELQLYLFRHFDIVGKDGSTTSLDDMEKKLATHVAYFARFPAVTRHWQHAGWDAFTVSRDNNKPLYWTKEEETESYLINTRWIFEAEFAALVGDGEAAQWPTGSRPGTISLPATVFAECFLPALYRHVQLDLIHMFIHLNSARNSEQDMWRERSRFYGGTGGRMGLLHTLLYREMAPGGAFPLFEHGGSALYIELLLDYNLRQQAYASPITSHVPQYLDDKRRRIAAANQKRGADPASQVSQLIDIEDLFENPEQVMPPCMSQVMRQQWFKNDDRLNLVATLIDMGYTNKEDVVNVMCRKRGEDAAFDYGTIEAIYDGKAKKKQEAVKENTEGGGVIPPGGSVRSKSYMGRCSIRCGSIINATFQAGNNIRCPYEEKLNGEVRRSNHTDHEKRKMTLKCGATLEAGYKVISPMDYIAFKARKLVMANTSNQKQQSL